MAYPLDSGATYTTKQNNVDIINDSDVNNLQTEITAIKTKVGVDGSAVTTTHDYKLGEVTGTNKALTSGTSGQSVTGLSLVTPTITSPVVNVGSDATGDMYYRNAGVLTRIPVGTDNQILKLNGTTPNWEAETVTVNASTTVAGIVEEATQAEVDAGTSTGATGARLFVNPSTITPGLVSTSFTAAESITAGQPVSAYYYQSDGGVLLDAKTTNNSSVGTSGGTVTIPFTVASNTNRLLIVYVAVGQSSGAVAIPTVTYNSVSMSAGNSQTVISSTKFFSFTLSAPSTGTNNIVITLSGTGFTQYVSTCVNSYYNVSGIESTTGAATYTVTYGTPAKGVLISSAGGGQPASASTNTGSNYQNSGSNTYTACVSGDSGVSFTTASTDVAFQNIGSQAIITIGLTPVTSLSYGTVVKSSASTPTNAVNLNKYTNFIGFAQNSVSVGQSVKVSTSGLITGLTSLTPLSTYYLANTEGTISTTAGTNSKKIGIAPSSTTILLKDSI